MPRLKLTSSIRSGHLREDRQVNSFRFADNTPRASYFASRNHVSGQRWHLSDYPTNQALGQCRFFGDILPSQSFAPPELIFAIQPFVAQASVLKNDQCTSEEIVMNAIEQKRRTFLFG